MVRLKTVLKGLPGSSAKSKSDTMKDKSKVPKEKRLKPSKSLIDVSIFRDRKKKKKTEEKKAASYWDVSHHSPSYRKESWDSAMPPSDEEGAVMKGHLKRSSSVGNLSSYSVNQTVDVEAYPKSPENYASSSGSSRPPSQVTWAQDSSDDSVSTRTTISASIAERSDAVKKLSRSTPAISPSASPEKRGNVGPRRPISTSRAKKFFRRFPRVDASEKVLDSYACALVGDILLQGTLFITDNYFAFHSNIFGYVSKVLIPICQVAGIQKEKTAKFIPNAILVRTKDKSYVFSSLLSRDTTYQFMIFTWRKIQRMPESEDENTFVIPTVTDEMFDEDSISGEDSVIDYELPPRSTNKHLPINMKTESPIRGWKGSAPVISATYDNSQYTSVGQSSSSETTVDAPYITIRKISHDNGKMKPRHISEKPMRKPSNDRPAIPNSAPYQRKRDVAWGYYWSLLRVITYAISGLFRFIFKGISNVASICQQSFLLTTSSVLVVFLLLSAGFMLHRVEELGKRVSSGEHSHSNNLHEDVLQMQQKLHSALASEVEKTIAAQMKQMATVRQSLEALLFLFNQQPLPSGQMLSSNGATTDDLQSPQP